MLVPLNILNTGLEFFNVLIMDSILRKVPAPSTSSNEPLPPQINQ